MTSTLPPPEDQGPNYDELADDDEFEDERESNDLVGTDESELDADDDLDDDESDGAGRSS